MNESNDSQLTCVHVCVFAQEKYCIRRVVYSLCSTALCRSRFRLQQSGVSVWVYAEVLFASEAL